MSNTRVPLDTTTAQSIRKFREAMELSQEALAKKARVPRARIKRIEHNELVTIDQNELRRIRSALGIGEKASSAKTRSSKTAAKRRASKATVRTISTKPKTTRRAIMRLLDEAGVLDMTLRELLN